MHTTKKDIYAAFDRIEFLEKRLSGLRDRLEAVEESDLDHCYAIADLQRRSILWHLLQIWKRIKGDR